MPKRGIAYAILTRGNPAKRLLACAELVEVQRFRAVVEILLHIPGKSRCHSVLNAVARLCAAWRSTVWRLAQWRISEHKTGNTPQMLM
jgi:hypothetical protein